MATYYPQKEYYDYPNIYNADARQEFPHWVREPVSIPDHGKESVSMKELDFWQWLDKYGEGHAIDDKVNYLSQFGFVKGVDTVLSEDLELMCTVSNYYWWLDYQKEKRG